MFGINKKGSTWKKWDFHVHTPESSLTNQLGTDWDTFVDKLIDKINEHKIEAIVTADYFTVDGYKKLIDMGYYDEESKLLKVNDKSVNILIVPGVELRLNIFNSDNESINLHVAFDPQKCSAAFIKSSFLEELKISYRDTEYKLKEHDILAIGKTLKEGGKINVGPSFQDIPSDLKKLYVKEALSKITLFKNTINDALKDIDNILTPHLSSSSYLVLVVAKGHGDISSLKWFEDNMGFSRMGLVREDLTCQADIILSNNENDISFYLGKNPNTNPEEIIDRFSSLKPCVWGSDSKDLDKLLHPLGGSTNDYTWLKADTSFEGLRQIILEPEFRVKISENTPSSIETYAKIENLTVDFPDNLEIKDGEETSKFCLNSKISINFSNNLTCIVGGRGSGKSTFLHTLYNAWELRDPNKLRDIDSPLSKLQLETLDVMARIRSITSTSIPEDTEFFFQNETEEYAKDIHSMTKLINNRLDKLSLTLDHDNLDDLYIINIDEKDKIEAIENVIDSISSFKKDISLNQKKADTLNKQLGVIESKEYKEIQNNLKEIVEKTSTFEKYRLQYSEIYSQINKLLKYIDSLDWSNLKSDKNLDELKKSLDTHITNISEEFEERKKEFTNEDYASKIKEQRTLLKDFLKKEGLSEENIGEIANATEEIEELENDINKLKIQLIPLEERYSSVDKAIKYYRTSYENYIEIYKKSAKKLQDTLSKFKFTKDGQELSFEITIDIDAVKTSVGSFIKQQYPLTLQIDNIKNVLFGDENYSIEKLLENKNNIIDVIKNSTGAKMHTQALTELVKDPYILERIYLELFEHYYNVDNIVINTKVGPKSLKNTSFGERCGIVVGIILAAGTNPIIIDQPEDNLDGEFIAKVLVQLIKDQKLNRQIIMITRDANLVIGTDAEQIIILETDPETKSTLAYSSTIENKEHRKKYIWILDGGETAFKMRENKYDILEANI